eukprot:2316341-Pleurochrysis_carterae.AAC.4
MQSFERSTHGRNWIFTEPQLAELRHKLYEQTAEKLKSAEAEKGITTSNLTGDECALKMRQWRSLEFCWRTLRRIVLTSLQMQSLYSYDGPE